MGRAKPRLVAPKGATTSSIFQAVVASASPIHRTQVERRLPVVCRQTLRHTMSASSGHRSRRQLSAQACAFGIKWRFAQHTSTMRLAQDGNVVLAASDKMFGSDEAHR